MTFFYVVAALIVGVITVGWIMLGLIGFAIAISFIDFVWWALTEKKASE